MPGGTTGRSWPVTPVFAAGLYAGTAELYAAHRIPYPAALLDDLRQMLPPAPGGLLDLACGTGELAIPLSSQFGQVWAADQEPSMIEVGRRKALHAGIGNIDWLVETAENLAMPAQSLDLITIGNAFHRLDRPAVAQLAMQWLKPGGVLALVNTDSVWRGTRPWQQATVGIIAKWTVPPACPSTRGPRQTHQDVLHHAGFHNIEETHYTATHLWTVDDFIGYLHSTSLATKAALGDNAQRFETDLRHTLLDLEPDGRLEETAGFSCLTARRPDTTQAPPA